MAKKSCRRPTVSKFASETAEESRGREEELEVVKVFQEVFELNRTNALQASSCTPPDVYVHF